MRGELAKEPGGTYSVCGGEKGGRRWEGGLYKVGSCCKDLGEPGGEVVARLQSLHITAFISRKDRKLSFQGFRKRHFSFRVVAVDGRFQIYARFAHII